MSEDRDIWADTGDQAVTDLRLSVASIMLDAGISEPMASSLADRIIRECFRWRPIETAPKDGRPLLCMRAGWDHPDVLSWKHNKLMDRRYFTKVNPSYAFTDEDERWLSEHSAEYFGDPMDDNDYDRATETGRATHYLPLDHLPPPEDEL